jgi:hypothetical protein
MTYLHEGPNLYLTADDQVVEEGDPRAATLLVATGCELAPDVATKYGLGKKKRTAADQDDSDEPKAKDAPANKAKAPAQPNKAG